MDETCEIRVYDRDFNWLDVCVLPESVQFSRDLFDTGSFEIHVEPDKMGAYALATPGNFIIINGDARKSGIVRDFYIEEARGKAVFVIYGAPAKSLAARRVTVPPTEAQVPGALGWDKINACGESILKNYAARNMTAAFDGNRNFERLVIAPDKGRGTVTPWKTRFVPLDEELAAIGRFTGLGYEIYADLPNRRWVFDVMAGVDRTREQSARSPVTFRLDFQNIEGYKYSVDNTNFKSTGYAGGAGEDEKRLVYALGAESCSYDRFEVFLDCASAKDITELLYYGGQKLTELRRANTIEAGALPNAFDFEVDYFLGDRVSVFIKRLDLWFDTRIEAVKEIWERPSGYRYEIRFGEKVPNLFTMLKKRAEVL